MACCLHIAVYVFVSLHYVLSQLAILGLHGVLHCASGGDIEIVKNTEVLFYGILISSADIRCLR